MNLQLIFTQGCLFYVPHYIWKNIEDGKVGLISQGIRGMFALPPKERASRQKRLVNYILESLRTHNGYSFGYFLCEILNLVNVIANILFIDVSEKFAFFNAFVTIINFCIFFYFFRGKKLQRFLGGSFLTYGTDVIHFSNVSIETGAFDSFSISFLDDFFFIYANKNPTDESRES